MNHQCFISFKMEDEEYKTQIQSFDGISYIDKSLDDEIDSDDIDYILGVIREQLNPSTVTIHLIGSHSAEQAGAEEQRFIKRELQASLFEGGEDNTKNGILGVVLPSMVSQIFRGSYQCSRCGGSHKLVAINDETTIKEFSYNYYVPNDSCSHTEEDRYCVLVKWADFAADPGTYIQKAFDKRTAPIAAKTKVRP